MRKKAKARKRGEAFVVSDDEEDMRIFSYRCQKRKERGKADTKLFFCQ